MGLSFDTISSTGANAGRSMNYHPMLTCLAVIHYSPPEVGSATIDPAQMYLCDSGGGSKPGSFGKTC